MPASSAASGRSRRSNRTVGGLDVEVGEIGGRRHRADIGAQAAQQPPDQAVDILFRRRDRHPLHPIVPDDPDRKPVMIGTLKDQIGLAAGHVAARREADSLACRGSLRQGGDREDKNEHEAHDDDLLDGSRPQNDRKRRARGSDPPDSHT